MKHLKISPEYGTGPLWVSNNGEIFEYLDLNESSLNTQLIYKINEWIDLFNLTYNESYPPDSGFLDVKQEMKFELKGYEIWKIIKEEYSDIYNPVIYYSYGLSTLFDNHEVYYQSLISRYKGMGIY